MAVHDEPSAAQQAGDVSDPVKEADLEWVLEDVPRGAFALCGIAVAILLACWLAIYFGVFLPRGPVG
ncbi:MAG TPA: cytochrome c oxidase subunit 2A [Geminicoccaceae bacterium]|nr:cytochrome c oxidase subunit 2A [Geminicoccaceae bacterium]